MKAKKEQHLELELEPEQGPILLDGRDTLAELLAEKKIYDLEGVSRVTGLCVRYLRQLCCHRKVAHHKLLGRYYMTPAEVAALMKPVSARR